MPSAYTARNRLTKQATGENVNVWGNILNSGVFDLVDFLSDGIVTISASGATTLSTANGSADQARGRILNVTAATAATITIPSVEKLYIVRAASADVTITNGSSSVTVRSGDVGYVVTDGASVWLGGVTDFGGRRLKNIGTPTQTTDAATKGYADGLAFAPVLPGQSGNEGKVISTDGTTAFWQALDLAFLTAALGFEPADAATVPAEATAADLQALTATDLYVSPASIAGAVALNALNLTAPDLSKTVQTHTMAANGTLGAPTNVTPGTTGCILIKQPASGGPYTLAYNAAWYPFGAAPTLSTAANAVDLLTWFAETASKVRFTLTKGGAA